MSDTSGEWVPGLQTLNIADIQSIAPIPPGNVSPPEGKDRCALRVDGGDAHLYCFLSYSEVCERINAKIKELA